MFHRLFTRVHCRFVLLWLAALTVFLPIQKASALNLAWSGAVSSDWSNPANWNPAAVPTTNDTVSISSGTITAAPNSVFGTLNFSGGDLSGTFAVRNTMNWSAGNLRSGNAGTILNAGVWNDAASASYNNAYGGTLASFTNNGIYNKTASGTTQFQIPFINNNGTVYVSVGTLDDASALKLAMNIWTDSALPWMHLDPALEVHAKNRLIKT